jgi:hypothetical protein
MPFVCRILPALFFGRTWRLFSIAVNFVGSVSSSSGVCVLTGEAISGDLGCGSMLASSGVSSSLIHVKMEAEIREAKGDNMGETIEKRKNMSIFTSPSTPSHIN